MNLFHRYCFQLAFAEVPKGYEDGLNPLDAGLMSFCCLQLFTTGCPKVTVTRGQWPLRTAGKWAMISILHVTQPGHHSY